jgi:nucleoside-diphosphate-sugar epimerase
LLSDGHQVVCLDSFATARRENVSELLKDADFHLVEYDIVIPAPDLGRFDNVLNIASPASPTDFRSRAAEIAAVNSVGTQNLISVARESDAKFFLASTSEAYGDPLVHPQPETYWGNVNPVGERSCYDESKRFAETLTYIAHQSYGLETRTVRIFNTYGPRQRLDDGRAVVDFIVRAVRGEPLIVNGDGSQTRSWCYVDDLVEGILLVLNSPDSSGRVVNLGNPVEISILEIARKIIELTGSDSPIEHTSLPENDPTRRCPDISLARELLGWEPRISLDEGLHRSIDWYRPRALSQ